MTKTCELCGRGMARKMILPTWWPYEYVCERSRCKAAVLDAIDAIELARPNSVAHQIAVRHEEQSVPIGWRTDAMARIQFDDPGWWANEIVKRKV